MDFIERVGSGLRGLWESYTDLMQREPWLVIVIAALAVVALVGAVAWSRARRHHVTTATAAPTTRSGDARTTIRRPVFIDPLLLDDLLAHVETRDYSRDLRDTLEGGHLEDTDATAETRKLNKVLNGLRGRTDLVSDLDRNVDADLEVGRAVLVTGTLTELPATAAAELLELSVPLFAHAPSSNGNHGALQTRPTHAEVATQAQPGGPLVVRMRPDGDRRSFLAVLPRDGLRGGDPDALGGRVTMLAVVDQVLGSRERIEADAYLTPGLSHDVREHVRDRDIGEVVASLAKGAGTDLEETDLRFKGPGARVSAAAIYR